MEIKAGQVPFLEIFGPWICIAGYFYKKKMTETLLLLQISLDGNVTQSLSQLCMVLTP